MRLRKYLFKMTNNSTPVATRVKGNNRYCIILRADTVLNNKISWLFGPRRLLSAHCLMRSVIKVELLTFDRRKKTAIHTLNLKTCQQPSSVAEGCNQQAKYGVYWRSMRWLIVWCWTHWSPWWKLKTGALNIVPILYDSLWWFLPLVATGWDEGYQSQFHSHPPLNLTISYTVKK